MNLNDKDFAASEYARARVEEIKRKVSSSRAASKQNYSTSTVSRQFSDSKWTGLPTKQEKTGLREALTTKQINEYQNRIKNIDSINQKIKTILGSTSAFPKKENIVQAPPSKTQYSSYSKEKFETRKQNELAYKVRDLDKKQSLADFAMTKQTISIEYQKQSKYLSGKIDSIKDIGLKKYENEENSYSQDYHSQKQQKPIQKIKQETPKENAGFSKKPSNSKQESSHPGNKTVTRLAEMLSEQIILDQKFRQAKWVFSEWNNPKKWDLLLAKYQEKYRCTSVEEAKQVFEICSEQHNPFFETPSYVDENCINDLLLTYKQAFDFWQIKVDECAEIKKLQKQFFNVKDIDLNKKGHISVEDLVCFVNLYTGNFFRNRDVVSLYRRFTKSQKLSFERFLDKVTK